MSSVSRYWKFVRINPAGGIRIEEVTAAKAFFLQQFPDLTQQDRYIQRRLWELRQGSKTLNELKAPIETPGVLAEYCLRCCISHQILESCKHIELQFGQTHHFCHDELLPFVLDDSYPVRSQQNAKSTYESLATKILNSFEPDRSNLGTWVRLLVKMHPEITGFLLGHGVYSVSDWAILNDTSPRQLERILTEYFFQDHLERQKNCALLEAYHAIYRQERMQLRQLSRGSSCSPPTYEQLQKIAMRLEEVQSPSPKRVMQELQSLALLLRNHRIQRRSGNVAAALPVNDQLIDNIADDRSMKDEEEEQQHEQFLIRYRHLLIQSLDQAIATAISSRLTLLRSKRSRNKDDRDQTYLKALHLFFCEKQSMTTIARHIGLEQYQVSRLLKLSELRADIGQECLRILPKRVFEESQQFVEPERLATLFHSIKTFLEEEIAAIVSQDASESMTPGNRRLHSLLSVRISHYLQGTRN